MSYPMQTRQVISLRTKKRHTKKNILIGRALCKKSKRKTQNKETLATIEYSSQRRKTNQEQSGANWNGRKGKVFCCLVCAVLIETVLSL